ncbi:uncharacterized protein FIBRA_00941 [Fibroporia radiculosa]|uniref:Protein ZIP4 homolog n=1 Tax=Fibroporia radiculosa TaxID=599839 RepID=J4H0U0_9APHY|nr:uncharacterized protein FIBRA_00941 [Fibroporia radiculosa]CCL98934.1 predicted protein [Fibroporia radiculosa]
MSASKRKLPPGVQDIYQEIKGMLSTYTAQTHPNYMRRILDILINIKANLNDNKRSARSTICTELQKLASLAESFTKQRPRSNKDWIRLADDLDREGVHLWNASASMQDAGDEEGQAVSATCLIGAGCELSKISATACLMLLWQFGDRQYQAKRWSEAADWFLAGTSGVFESISALSNSKCFRKAALCYIQQAEYAKAAAVIRRCSQDEAATHYLQLLTAVHQGLEDEAISAVKAMVKTSDFNRKMLMLATTLANESNMKSLLLSVLEALLNTVQSCTTPDMDVEAITLVRCIIRLVLKVLAEPASDRTSLIPRLIKHFNTALKIIEGLDAQQKVTMVSRDISWLWRTAYNCAIQGCTEWMELEANISDLFDIARQLLEAYQDATLTDIDVEIHIHIINASFAAIVGRVLAVRRLALGDIGDNDRAQRVKELSDDIVSCKKRIQNVINTSKVLVDDEILRAQSLLHVLRVFEAEVIHQMKDWSRLLLVIQEIVSSDALAVNTFEAIVDILWVDKECPVDVLFTALEAILHASLDRDSLSIDKFSRWLRAICTMLLSRNTPADRAKAIGYVEQAVQVLQNCTAESTSEGEYPLDERYWVLGTSFNTGIECLHASSLDEAKRWFEISTTICRFVPDGRTRADKIVTHGEDISVVFSIARTLCIWPRVSADLNEMASWRKF